MEQKNSKQNGSRKAAPVKKRRLLGVLMILAALVVMQLPVAEADAASSASDFRIEKDTLVKYRGSEKNVTIPDTVEIIGRGAFEDNTNIELVVVPGSVKRIDPYAFWGCDNLDTVVLGRGLAEVGDHAFMGCKGLVQMTIPSNVTAIGIRAFADCVNLKDISIPAETTQIHETAFDGCNNLTIHCDPNTVASEYAESFYARRAENSEYGEAAGEASPEPENTQAPAEPELPAPVPTEPPVEGLTLGTTHIVGNRAVILMDSRQFKVYEGTPEPELTSPPVADLMDEGAIPKYRIVDGRIVADQAYYHRMDLGDVALQDGIREVGEFSYARSSLRSIVLPQGVEKISYGAFYHCDALERMVLPDTIRCVEPKAFSSTPWVENFLDGRTGEGDFLVEGGVLAAYRGTKENAEVPEGVRVIAAEVFRNHTEIKSVTLPESLLVIGEGAFEGCGSLRQITFGGNEEEIKDRAFAGVSFQLDHVALPASVKKLGLQAFGSIRLDYEGEEPEHTYEDSAARLSNMAYRFYNSADSQLAGVAVAVQNGTAGFGGVTGSDGTAGSGGEADSGGTAGSESAAPLENASASLDGADRSYTLTVGTAEDVSGMERACRRVFGVSLPEDCVIYDLALADSSHIPLKELGDQMLTVVLPVPEALRGRKLRALSLDRNGQLEDLEAERVLAEGVESVQFRTDYVSQIAVYGIGGAEEDAMELNVAMEDFSAGPVGTAFSAGDGVLDGGSRADYSNEPFLWHRPGFWFGSVLLAAGLVLLLTGSGRKER